MDNSPFLRQDAAGLGAFSRHRDLWAVGILLLLSILFFADPLFSSKSYYFRDILNFHYPLHRFLIDCYSRGEFPLWNPFVYLGQPMLANPNYLAVYPTNLFHVFLAFNYAFKLHFIVHVIFAGLGLYFLQRRLGLTWAASLLGAVAYEFSGAVLSFLNLYNLVPAVALLPWIAWAFVGALEKSLIRRSLGFGALLAIQLVALEPLLFQCTVGLLAALTAHRLLESSDRLKDLGRSIAVGLTGVLFALGLAAVQVLPSLELIPRTGRGVATSWAEASVRSMHPLDLLNVVIPSLFGDYCTLNFATSWGESIHQGRESYLVSFFLGTLTLLLAALSALSVRRRLRTVMACLAIVSVAWAFGTYNPVYHWLFDHFSFFHLGRYPSKFFLLASLSVSVLASLGFEVVIRAGDSSSRKRRRITVAGLCGLVLGSAILAYGITWQSRLSQVERWIASETGEDLKASKDMPAILGQLKRSVQSSGVFLLLGGALVAAAPLWRRRPVKCGLMLSLVATELMLAHLNLSPLLPDGDVDFVPEVNKYLGGLSAQEVLRVAPPTLLGQVEGVQLRVPSRSYAWLILFYRLSGQPYDGIMNGIQYSLDRSVDRMGTLESEEIRRACLSLPKPDALTLLAKLNSSLILSLGEMNEPRVRRLATFGTASNRDLSLYRLEKAAGRALFATKVEAADSHAGALVKFIRPDFPYDSAVVLECPRAASDSGSSGGGNAFIERYENQRVVCRVEANQAGYLVLLDSYYPGWKAYLDGAGVEVLRADYAFRAVAVPAGNHEVEFRYRPTTFYWGLAISSVALILGLAAATSAAVRKRRSAAQTSASSVT